MNKRYLILDCNYLCHRAKYVFGDLSDKGSATGVVYGFLKDVLYLRKRFDSDHFIFCWDYGESLRKKIMSTYKENRRPKERTKAEKAFEEAFQSQMHKLREEYLHTIGFKNVLYQDGYEADDIIAIVCRNIEADDEGIIVTADKDLWQCIRPNIHWYDPRKKETITYGKFKKRFDIRPKEWAKVLAIAGCNTDNVKGIQRVGQKTALSFLTRRSASTTKANVAIKEGWKKVVLQNRAVVQLPLRGTKPVKFAKDRITQTGWNRVTKRLGMKSIRAGRLS
jgi:DNA polymerase-1